jgi:hypothetical protein
MPSEIPHMPKETHRSMLRYGESRGLGLQAGEVAWYPNRNDLNARSIRYIKRAGIITIAIIVLSSLIAIRASM